MFALHAPTASRSWPGKCESRIQTIADDIADPRHRQAIIEMPCSHGRLDVLVNNAGMS